MTANPQAVLIVMTNMPDRDSANRLAHALVEQKHAACVNVMADCKSVYRWEGKIETAVEVPVVIKTSASAYPRVEEGIRKHHPYKVPEIVGIEVDAGLPAYLAWVMAEVADRS
ncbi:MAG TPA: divalent-cation tolerance protein CutA [Burkholderiales bacterium]|nr:divalent-cation tolerance protein CutA [Burkholderiales bacterium]